MSFGKSLKLPSDLNFNFHSALNLKSAMGMVNVKGFGAKGDGVTDDTEAIQAAIDAVKAAGGGIVFFPPGVYNITATIQLRVNVTIMGTGWNLYPHDSGASVIKKMFDGDMLYYNGDIEGSLENGFTIRDIVLFGNGASYTGGGIHIYKGGGWTLTHVLVTQCKSTSVHAESCGVHFIDRCRFIEQFSDVDDSLIYEDGSGDWQITNCDLGNTAIYRDKVTGLLNTGTGKISSCKIFHCRVGINSTGTLQVTDNQINDCYDYGIAVSGQCSVVIGNFIYSLYADSEASTFIAINSNNRYILIEANVIKYLSGHTYGITLGGNACYNIVTGNFLYGQATYPIYANNYETHIIANNSAEGSTPSYPSVHWMNAAPTTGTWRRGDIVWNISPSAGGPPGWVCVASGTPGTWKAMANLAT